jgi:hypothetical protein
MARGDMERIFIVSSAVVLEMHMCQSASAGPITVITWEDHTYPFDKIGLLSDCALRSGNWVKCKIVWCRGDTFGLFDRQDYPSCSLFSV